MRRYLALSCALALSACGFHPLYGPEAGQPARIASRMDEIDIAPLADRQGQVMHQALEAALQRDGAPSFYRYHLTVQYGISVQIIGVQQDTSNTRNRFLATAHWELTPEGNLTTKLAEGNAQAMDAENIIDNQYFANTLDGGVMRHQLARELANQIAMQLALYFRAHPDHGA
ncbi:hypothetical protein AruPA_14420 [Acidiphilium sp. PA]|uniref:hypothetical protein n=1 Tax=Acidiphilium sp. PA TaxID=2871705 RepID=UPI0022440B14|nr:hypothetical protein [Acidiphilium sp. PA]MCW8308232.1 hypothetical protein [Acidiphilium sp. PA]